MDALELTDFRAAVARMYLAGTNPTEFRAERDKLFATHPQSAIAEEERASFAGLRYFPPNEDVIVEADVRPADGEIDIDTGGPDGVVHYNRVGIIETPPAIVTETSCTALARMKQMDSTTCIES